MTSLALLLAAATFGAPSEFGWNQTDHSLSLVRGNAVLWQFNFRKSEGKPYFHPLTVAGSPPLTELRPKDHPWHRALWFSWKTINGVLYWEEDRQTGKSPGVTELLEVRTTARRDFSARFELALSYHPPDRPAVLTEKSTIEVSPPGPDGGYRIDWQSVFTAGDQEVRLDRTPIAGEPNGVEWGGYAGLSLRLAPMLRDWHFADETGPVKAAATQARWMSFSGPLEHGKTAAIVVLDHPKSFRHPTPWYLIPSMPYFSPAVLYRAPYTLPARTSMTLKYRMLFLPGAVDRDAVQSEWQRFAAEP
jgi:hypothetical protein